MDSLHLSIPLDVYAYLLKECTQLKDAESGSQVYSHMTQNGYQPTLLLANRLLLMYASCARLVSAHQLFDKMIVKDSVTWATMIAGHFDNGDHLETLTLFKQMREQCGFEQSMWRLIVDCVLLACIQTGDFGLGQQVHGLVFKMDKKIFNKGGGCSDELFIGSLLINFYGKLGCISSARCIFDKMELRDTVVWTNMIVVYNREEHFQEVLEVFKEMGRAGTKKNNFTLSSVIRACGRMGDERSGRQAHCNAIKLGIELDQFVRCSLVDMYGKCGMVKDARKLFEMARRYEKKTNDVCWNAMLTAYVQNGFYNEAIKFLYEMKSNGVQPPESLLNQVRVDCVN
ncbi:Pentatricopeptide repeat-containing protein [Thalictrum thalictroides]|uniref:Pentatricopeptide repeat-containing protein n=1 Tax=Thalictrum thalictroides TaxID=46969 RepID=A0A7J6XCS0_THATH|nr:Pentatricopeptide repeat-containing protein [Thalictrum thalictroides]